MTDNRTDLERETDKFIEDVHTAYRTSAIIGTAIGVLIAGGLFLGFFYFFGMVFL